MAMDYFEKSPLFLCGFPSGGTDLLKTILNAHPNIYISSEMPFIYDLYRYGYDKNVRFSSKEDLERFRELLIKLDLWKNLQNLTETINVDESAPKSIQEVLRIWFTDRQEIVWGNKTPQNTENMQNLSELFPEGKFIFIVRDVREICLSWKRKWGKDIRLCSVKWNHRMRMGKDFADKNPDKVLVIKFEDLVNDTRGTCHKMTDFLGISYSDNMENHYEFVGEKFDGKANYGAPIIKENVNKWKNLFSEKQIREIEQLAFSSMGLFGYQTIYARSEKKISFIAFGFFQLKDLYATLFFGNKYSKSNRIQPRLINAMHEVRKRLR